MYDSNYSNSYNQNDSNQQSGNTSGGNSQGYSSQSYNTQNTYGYQSDAYRNASYGQNAGQYQYGNMYAGSHQSGTEGKKKKEKKAGNGNSYLKKALVCVSLGLFFGICAGLGFYAVCITTGMLDQNTTQNVEVLSQDAEKAGAAEGNAEDGNAEVSETSQAAAETTDIQKTQTVSAVVADVSDVVSDVMPAVVSISNTYTETMSYFGQAMTSEAVATGSGIIVGKNDSELLIVTNYHVVAEAEKLSIQFVEGSEAEASVKGTDADMDLAVIAVPLENILNSTLDEIAIASLGDSDSLTVGEPAIAIGNSLGYGQSVTTGVISALNREIEFSGGGSGTFIQTDAAINPGNSGGALLNLKGEVIGINSSKIGGSAVEGMGYAIPISAAKPIIADLMMKETKTKVAEEERGFLGISGISVTEEVSSAYGMPEGVYVAQVYEGTAAAQAGLKKGDIIVTFDGEDVASMDELQKLLEYYAKGDTVEMKIMTLGSGGYHSKTISITLGNKAEQ